MYRSMQNLPEYIHRAGDQVFAPPFAMKGQTVLLLMVKADRTKLQALIDRELNAPWRSAFEIRGVRHHYRASSDFVACVVAQTNELYPAVFERLKELKEPERRTEELATIRSIYRRFNQLSDKQIEALSDVTASQRELLVMVPIEDLGADPEAEDPIARSSRLWYLPIVLNDLPPAVLAGRELFGYPKLLAEFVLKNGKKETDDFITEGKVGWSKLSVRTHAPRRAAGKVNGRSKYTLDFVDVLHIHRKAKAKVSAATIEQTRVAGEVAHSLFRKPVDFLFLRQFRDPEFEDKASYQAAVTGSVTAATGSISSALQKRPDEERFELEFPKIGDEQPPLVDALGILKEGSDRVTASAAFILTDQNLIVTRGEVEWDKA